MLRCGGDLCSVIYMSTTAYDIDPSDRYDLDREWEIRPYDYTATLPPLAGTVTQHPVSCPCQICRADVEALWAESRPQPKESNMMTDRTINLSAEQYDLILWALGEAPAKYADECDTLFEKLVADHGMPIDPVPEQTHDLGRCTCDTCDEDRADLASMRAVR